MTGSKDALTELELWHEIQRQSPELAQSMRDKTDHGMSLYLKEINSHFTIASLVIGKPNTGD